MKRLIYIILGFALLALAGVTCVYMTLVNPAHRVTIWIIFFLAVAFFVIGCIMLVKGFKKN